MDTPVIYDKLGQPITPGCYIIYGHALGRCASIALGKVFKVGEVETPYRNHKAYRITVRGISDDGCSVGDYLNKPDKKNDAFYKVELLSKLSTLQFPERCLVIPESQVPKTYLDLFATLTPDGKNK